MPYVNPPDCTASGCNRKVFARMLCGLHYHRERRWGDPLFVYKDGRTRTPEYRAWSSMRQRCEKSSHKSYHRYGGRGITVCERWSKFENFLEDMGRKPSDLHSLERIDNDGNYEPSNCRWATMKEQAQNRSTNIRDLCRYGHSMTEENTHYYLNRKLCRKCAAEKTARWRRARQNALV